MFAPHYETLFFILFTSFLLFQFNCGLSLHKNNPLENDVLGSSEVNTDFPVHGNDVLVRYFLVELANGWGGGPGKFKTDGGRFDRKMHSRRDTERGNGRFEAEIDDQRRIIDDYNEANKYLKRHRRQATETTPKSAQPTKSTSTDSNPIREPRFGRYWKHRHRPHHGHFGPPYFGPAYGHPPFGPPPGPPPYPGPGPWNGGPWDGPGDGDEEYDYGDGFDLHHHHHCGGHHGSDGKETDGKPSKGEGGGPGGDVKPVYEDTTEDPNDNTKFGVELLTPKTKTTDMTTKVPDIDIRFRVEDK